MRTRILKAENSNLPTPATATQKICLPRIITREEFAARSQVQAVLQEAKEQAARLINEARQKAEETAAQAQEQATEQIALLVLRAQEQAAHVIRNAERQLKELAVDIAAKIVGDSVRIDPATVVSIVARAMSELELSRELVVIVHPQDYVVLKENESMLKQKALCGILRIEPDPAVEPGGCIIHSERGTVDGQISTRLQTIRNFLTASSAVIRK